MFYTSFFVGHRSVLIERLYEGKGEGKWMREEKGGQGREKGGRDEGTARGPRFEKTTHRRQIAS